MKLQATLIAPLINTKGMAAPESKAAVERANLLIEQAEARSEPPEDPLLLLSVLFGYWLANMVGGSVEACRDVATQILGLAEKQQASVPLTLAHSCVGWSLMVGGEIAEGKKHLDQATALYDPVEYRLLAGDLAPAHHPLLVRQLRHGCLAIPTPR